MSMHPNYGARSSGLLDKLERLFVGDPRGAARRRSMRRGLQEAELREYESKAQQRQEKQRRYQEGLGTALGPGRGWVDPDTGVPSYGGGGLQYAPRSMQGMLEAWMRSGQSGGFKAGLESVTPPTPPTGFERTQAGLRPTPGGPASIPYKKAEAAATRAPRAVAPGGALVSPAGEELYSRPFKPETRTAAHRDAINLGLRPGTKPYSDYIRDRTLKPGVTVNIGPTGIDYGDAPKDMSWARDAQGKVLLETAPGTQYQRPVAVPVGGGEVEREAQAAEKQKTAREAQRRVYADVVTEDIDRALDKIDRATFPITGLGSLVSPIPGTAAHDLVQLITTVRSNTGFDRLQQMREASPTGGALGQVSDLENRLLQASIGALETSQTKEQLVHNLRRVKEIYLNIIHGEGNRPDEVGTGAPSGRPGTPGFAEKLRSLSDDELLRRLGVR